ncbi:NF-X1-type zinc finger protein NFXL1 [Glossina fuscipes]|uniref:NF-X1-type zinc finger protein NFXL1 n=1 Tax=Glossina fuscipes TaxID=7396 RepID=A0A9C5ZGI2_9MUSC|nr:NF-X1-type zinc finger protein NFXL1 [Glossina fuscipes]XP_037901245.1 NF-X1-type zinc finger protein NFXL1 [Glossina fuscipes]
MEEMASSMLSAEAVNNVYNIPTVTTQDDALASNSRLRGNKQFPIAGNKSNDKNTSRKFYEAHAKNLEAAKKLVDKYISSSEEEDELDETKILKALYKNYSDRKEDEHLLAKTASFLENILHSGSATCLICIASVKRTDAIWSCKHCYCFFHLNCIRRWANDSMAQRKAQERNIQGYYNHLGEYVSPKKEKALHWCCPQCRREFQPNEKPATYECFCGRETDPLPQPWLLPHSCGEICGKLLQPNCSHKCNILCHPGPCPPCAQYAITSCKCGKSKPKSMRCLEKDWECQEKCNSLLPCGRHKCRQLCHKPQQCPPCSQKSIQACECGAESMRRQCCERKWQCQQVCSKLYACGIHMCKKVCHSGDCGECPLSLPRSCPCGKTKKVGPCTEIIDTCGDTCQKILACGQHTCTQRCHKGNCNLCLVITKKKCRCGLHEKELPCSKEFTCETKCKQSRDCGIHSCNRKCCDRNCPPCTKLCGQPLSCGKHKCQSVCHKGPCYPCGQQSQVNCRCGKTRKSVPCGRERTVRIACLEHCKIPSKCHHVNQHRCHKNECPSCSQICGLPNNTTGCGHICKAKCHSYVKVSSKSNSETGHIWEPSKRIEYKSLPHPRCEEKVLVACIGGHEVEERPCWNSNPKSCQRLCNRQLPCGNHKCTLICHSVSHPDNMEAQQGCMSCENGCNIPRPNGCIHNCPRPCHLPPCNPCNVAIKTKCHCGLMQIIYKCCDYYNNQGAVTDIAERQERLKSCGNRCLKNYSCGHRCAAQCHAGPCPETNNCRKRLRIYCECKRLKQEISCDKHRSGLTKLKCDANCLDIIKKSEMSRHMAEESLRKQEEERNRLEVEQFEKRFNKRKHKERKSVELKEKREINWKLLFMYAGIFSAILLAVGLAFYEDH